MDTLGINRMFSVDQPQVVFLFDLFGMQAIENSKDVQLVPTSESLEDFVSINDAFEGIVNLVIVKFVSMDTSRSLDVSLGFVSHSDNILTISSMDMSHFQYLPICFDHMCDSLYCLSQHPFASHVFDIDDEPQSSHSNLYITSNHLGHGVEPVGGDFKIVDFG